MPVKQVSAGNLKKELTQAGDKLVLIDFFATWCGPCVGIAPTIEKLSESYPNAVFLKVDVDDCQDEAAQYQISAMPTFVFVRQSKELERIRGADPSGIERMLTKHYKATSAFSGEGHSMLSASTETSSAVSATESEIKLFEKLARERWATAAEGETITTLRLRLPDQPTPVNIRLSSDRTLYDVRRLLSETINTYQTTPFEFLQPPSMKISYEDEEKTINELKLLNAVLNIKKVL